ncbi:MAG: CHC2 zinc finger domain-containing protein [bacterium]|nr:CHC2 zinc finger domain-containing protein [bacterium]
MGSQAASLVREATDIVQLIEEVTEVTRTSGGAAMALCPFHPDNHTPSLSISGDKGVYNCFGCGERGDALTFVQKHHGVAFPEALRLLATRAGVDLGPQAARRSRAARLDDVRWQAAGFFCGMLRTDGAAGASRAYLRRVHGFGSGDVAGFRVGWAPPDMSAVTRTLREAGVSGRDVAASGVARLGLGAGRVVYPVVSGPARVAGFAAEDSSVV